MPERNKKIIEFAYSPFFIAYACLIALISYVAQFPFVGLAIFAAFACYIFLTGRDVTPIIPLLFLAIMQIRNTVDMTHPVSIIIFACAGICLIIHLILYPMNNPMRYKLTLPLSILTVTLFTAGFFSPYMNEYLRTVFFACAIGPVVFFVYLFFANYVCPPKNVDLKKYFCLVLTFIGIVSTIQIAIHKEFFFKYFSDLYPNVALIGWANVNGIAVCLFFSIASCSYLLAKSNQPIKYVVILMILFGGLFYTSSAGCIGVGIAFAPIAMFYTINRQKAQNKQNLFNAYFIIVITLIVAVTIKINECSKFLIHALTNDTGRTILYRDAIKQFIKYPIFGVGMAYENLEVTLIIDSVTAFNFHSTLFHTLATMGIVGIIAYVIYYVARFKIVMANDSTFNVFMLIAFMMFSVYAMVDTCEGNVVPCMIFATLCMAVVETTNKTYTPPLPLINKYHFKPL